MHVYEQCDEHNISETLDYIGYNGLNENGRINSKLYDWLVLFRKAGFDVDRIEKSSYRELTRLEKSFLSSDLDFFERMSVDVVMEGDGDYPNKYYVFLESGYPKMLFCMGNVSLLNQPSILVCGARDVSDTGLELAYKSGRLVAEAGYILVSGYARGVDLAAHLGALEAGGATIAILPYGFSRFRIRRQISDVSDPDHFLVVSELPPSCGFMVKAAFRRNKLLVALSDAIIVVEPGKSGGTWYSAEKAQEMQKPIFFLEGERQKIITRMESMGAKRLEVKNGTPQLGKVYEKC